MNHLLAHCHSVHTRVILYLLPPLQDYSTSFRLQFCLTERSSQELVFYVWLFIGRKCLFLGIQFFEF